MNHPARPKTPAERKSAERRRRRDAGLVRVVADVWVRPERVPAVQRLANKIRKLAE